MKVVDLHPDDLLDKDARGELSASELTRLEAHLSRCETCRFEREVRSDFADELSDEEELSPQALLALMEGMPVPAADDDKIALLPPEPEEPITPEEEALIAKLSKRPSKVRRYVRVLLLVAAALMLATGATASGVAARVWAHMSTAFAVEHGDEVTDQVTSTQTPATQPARVSAPVVARPSATEPVVRDETPTSAPPPPVVVETAPKPVAFVTPTENAASLFEQANQARRGGDYGRAIALNRRLETTYPSSREAHVSYATVGRLLLDRGDAAGALASFDAYQRKGPGPMDEAVIVGRATALERLGREDEARTAWGALLMAYPDTPYREHAEARFKGAPR